MSRDSQRETRDGLGRYDASRRAQNSPRPIIELAQELAGQRIAKPKNLVLQGQKNEGHLPHDELLQSRSQPKMFDRRMLGAR